MAGWTDLTGRIRADGISTSLRTGVKLALDAGKEIMTVFRSFSALIVYRLGQGILNP